MALTPHISNLMLQRLTYWPPGLPDGFGGVTFDPPTIVTCRWQDVHEMFHDAVGREVMSNAIIYPAQPLALKGRVALGVFSQSDPLDVEESFEIRQVKTSPSLKQDRELNKVWV